MGYDMYVVDEKGRSIGDVLNLSYKEVDSMCLYWRRNIFGGSAQADIFVEAGIGYWPTDPNFTNRPWPECECATHECPNDDYDACVEGDGRHLGCSVCLAHMRATGSEQPGISVYKLCGSNDGWWVTKQECVSALALWEANGKPELDKGYGDTLPFLLQAAHYDGFRVY